ncbi:MAG: methyl-accepting chemotaxis protein [Ferrovibrio sp.]|uniref:methyl-accepting chemotaxis protein n=1 Tax=Ferrovibrio sp. TaxID=1917215 RepID=UPI00261DFFF0|nr:methyl-accepting chemotaxis protein [Ferrovibrio sp.]MCW0233269.1 methyl-accepting chemotaxis protein [Ferrovibrio sp.]
MFQFSTGSNDLKAQFTAINRAQAIIEFTLDGKILTANENFLNAMGYTLAEIQGQHHSMFVTPAYRASADYKAFWAKLGRGEYEAAQYLRIGKGGREVWIQASYNPILDKRGRPYKVVKFATDITAQKLLMADYEGQLAAIGKSQAVIEFTLDGTILTANANFLNALGYSLDEVKGKHHSLFVAPADRDSAAYKAFWAKLGRGEYDANQYKRIGKGGREVWIQASYNPIMDASGRPFKVVKYATDVTAQTKAAQMMQLAVQQVQQVVDATKTNDLTQRIDLDGKSGEIRSLCAGVNDLVGAMSGIILNIRTASDTIAAASAEISTGSQDLAQRTESQAASIEETAASMHEVTSTVKLNADNAQAANQLAVAARDTAEKGGSVVNNAVTAVTQIEDSAQKIADIIGLIDEIAFQTNLLALNASVEAARAGEAGKGFAVVAQEVRALAQRSANASKDIKALIQTSNSQVKTGAALVNQAGQSLTEIVGAIKKVSDIVAEIAAASREQATGLEQINTAVASMDEMTQRNGALVEETSASAQALSNQAQELAALVQRYRTGDAAAPATVPAARQQAAAAAAPKPRAALAVAPRPASGGTGRPSHLPDSAPAAPQKFAAANSSDGNWEEF